MRQRKWSLAPHSKRDFDFELRLFKRFTKPSYGLVLAPFISHESARICTEAGVGYADFVGNARLSFDRIFIETRTEETPPVVKREARSVFSPKAARVLRVLLQGPLRASVQACAAKRQHLNSGA